MIEWSRVVVLSVLIDIMCKIIDVSQFHCIVELTLQLEHVHLVLVVTTSKITNAFNLLIMIVIVFTIRMHSVVNARRATM